MGEGFPWQWILNPSERGQPWLWSHEKYTTMGGWKVRAITFLGLRLEMREYPRDIT